MEHAEFELDALRALRGVVYPSDADFVRHKERLMNRFLSSLASPRAADRRLLWGGLALLAVGGLSYATGLTDIVSEWIVSVEPIDAENDRVVLEHTTMPELGFTVELPIDEAQELVDAANANELFVLEVLESDEGGSGETLLVQPLNDVEPTVEFIGADGETKHVNTPHKD